MPTISTIIITKNEEQHIQDCIETALWTDEIIVLDSGSSDRTQEICKEYVPKVKLYVTDWPGYGKQKNRALELANSDWILSIDADERITPELQAEILQVISSNSDCVAYQIPRVTYFYNRPMRYCFRSISDAPTRMIKKGEGRFTDATIHETLLASGKIKKLKSSLKHFSCDNLADVINKINSYSTLGALNLKQAQKKVNFAQVLAHAGWTFIKIYFLRLGFLDGWPGFLTSLSHAEGSFYKYAKLLEKNYIKTRESN